MRSRIALGTAGALLILFGAFRILTNTGQSDPVGLVEWLVAAVVLHDGVLVPLTITVGALLTRFVRPRPRRYLQGGLITAALVTAIAVPLIYRHGSQPRAKSLELQNYGLHLAVLVGLIAAFVAVAYAARVLRDRQLHPTGQPDGPNTGGGPATE
jgi:hypothetical protein